jgi:hypothetical protein
MGDPHKNQEQFDPIAQRTGFIATLDQNSGITPAMLARYRLCHDANNDGKFTTKLASPIEQVPAASNT